MKIHFWCPGIEPSSGGIEKYSSFLLIALEEKFGADAVSAFAKNDRLRYKANRAIPHTPVIRTGGIPLKLRTLVFSGALAIHAIIERPDLIISTHLNFGPLARMLKRCLKTPYWLSLHGIEAWNMTNTQRMRAIRDAELLLPVSRFTREVVKREQSLPNGRFKLLPDTFDSEEFSIGPKPQYLLDRYGLTERHAVILTVGRLAKLERYKGHDRILRILSDVRCRMSDVRYLIVGGGDDRTRLEKLAEELGVAELVIFTDKVTAEELNDHYNLCDLFTMPSTGEGFGIVFLEALACGKPVLAGNKDASSDALLDGELGVLVDPDDPAELRDAIVSILLHQKGEIRSSKFAIRIPDIIYQPEMLRQKVIENFGYEKFKNSLAGYLNEFFEKR